MWSVNKILALTCILSALNGASAARVNRRQGRIAASPKAEASSDSAVSALGYRSGDTLFGRFKLRNLIAAKSGAGLNYLPSSYAPVDFPEELKARYHGPDGPSSEAKFLGSGSFGETWVVTDSSGKHGNATEEFALKLFYTKNSTGAATFLTKEMIEQGDSALQKAYADTVRECQLAQKIHNEDVPSMGRGFERQMIRKSISLQNEMIRKATHLMSCYEHADDPAYVLLSYGGEDTLSSYMNTHVFEADAVDGHIGALFKQILMGLEVLAWCNPPLIHHDLKSQNIVVRMVNGKPKVTIIDFGSFREYTEKKQYWLIDGSVSTMTIAPPEWLGAHDDKKTDFVYCETLHRDESWTQWGQRMVPWAKGKPWFYRELKGRCSSAFDIYSAGAILVEMLTQHTPFSWATADQRVSNPLLNQPDWEFQKHKQLLSRVMAVPQALGQVKDFVGDMNSYMRKVYEWAQANCSTIDALAQLDTFANYTVPHNHAKSLAGTWLNSPVDTWPSRNFVDSYLPLMLSPHPEDRPAVADLLNSTWLSGYAVGRFL